MGESVMLITKVYEMFKKYDITVEDVIKAVKYLKTFGYLVKNKEASIDDIITAVQRFQEMFHIIQDGELGLQTVKTMDLPRCGHPDIMRLEDGTEIEHATALQKWGLKHLTYYIKNRVTYLDGQRTDPDLFDSIIADCFSESETIFDMTFERVNNPNNANLIIDSSSNRSEDFGQQSGVLGWAYLPSGTNYKGQLLCKLDNAESWRSNLRTGNGILLKNVFMHECSVGHMMGLPHSKVKSALMAPYYNPSVSTAQSPDDVENLVARYGKPKVTPDPEPDPKPVPTEGLNISIDKVPEDATISIPGYRVIRMG